MNRQELQAECKALGITFRPNETIKELSNKIKSFKMKKETENGNITPEQIEVWKKKYKTDKLHKLSVKVNENDTAVGYLRPV